MSKKFETYEEARAYFNAELEPVGLDCDDLSFLYKNLVGRDCPYAKKKFHQKRWKRIPHPHRPKEGVPLTFSVLVDHLLEKLWVAVLNHEWTNRIAIDLDTHSPSLLKMQDRFARVREAIPNTLAFASGLSGGIHLYMFLSKKRSFTELRDALERTLLDVGLILRRADIGDYEILPTLGNTLRVPLGKDSFLVNDDMEIAATSKREAIIVMRQFLAEKMISIADLKASAHRRISVGCSQETARCNNSASGFSGHAAHEKKRRSPDQLDLSMFADLNLDEVLSRPIQSPGVRHSLTFWVALQCKFRGMPRRLALDAIVKWYLTKKHKFKTQSGAAIDDAIRICRSVYKRRQRTYLTIGDVSFILEKINSGSGRIGRDRYKLMEFMYNVLWFFKAQGRQVCALSKNLLVNRLNGISNRTYLRGLVWCCDNYILSLREKADRKNRKARSFWLSYKFRQGTNVISLEHGIRLLLSDAEIRSRFTRSYVDNILAELA